MWPFVKILANFATSVSALAVKPSEGAIRGAALWRLGGSDNSLPEAEVRGMIGRV